MLHRPPARPFPRVVGRAAHLYQSAAVGRGAVTTRWFGLAGIHASAPGPSRPAAVPAAACEPAQTSGTGSNRSGGKRSTADDCEKLVGIELDSIKTDGRAGNRSSWKRWTTGDNEKLVGIVLDSMQTGVLPGWKNVAKHFPSRSLKSVMFKFHKLKPDVDPERISAAQSNRLRWRRWTADDIEKLVGIVLGSLQTDGRPGWKNVARQFPLRSPDAVTRKFYKLKPGIRSYIRRSWSSHGQQEDVRISNETLPYRETLPVRHSSDSSQLLGRSQRACKDKSYQLQVLGDLLEFRVSGTVEQERQGTDKLVDETSDRNVTRSLHNVDGLSALTSTVGSVSGTPANCLQE